MNTVSLRREEPVVTACEFTTTSQCHYISAISAISGGKRSVGHCAIIFFVVFTVPSAIVVRTMAGAVVVWLSLMPESE